LNGWSFHRCHVTAWSLEVVPVEEAPIVGLPVRPDIIRRG